MNVEAAEGGVRLSLDRHEADLLRRLAREMRALLDDGDEDDPVLDRLFPRAYDDDEDERTFRELTEDSLETSKLEGIGILSATLGPDGPVDETLDPEAADRWVRALTDLRVAIGVRMDVDEERMGAEIDPADPDAGSLSVLHWLGFLQQTLLEALGEPPDGGP